MGKPLRDKTHQGKKSVPFPNDFSWVFSPCQGENAKDLVLGVCRGCQLGLWPFAFLQSLGNRRVHSCLVRSRRRTVNGRYRHNWQRSLAFVRVCTGIVRLAILRVGDVLGLIMPSLLKVFCPQNLISCIKMGQISNIESGGHVTLTWNVYPVRIVVNAL